MLSRLKHYLLIALAAGAFYFLLSHHFIFTSWKSFDLLKKDQLTLKYTFYSLEQSRPEDTLRIEALRDAGIGELMVDKGMISEERLDWILRRIDAKQ